MEIGYGGGGVEGIQGGGVAREARGFGLREGWARSNRAGKGGQPEHADEGGGCEPKGTKARSGEGVRGTAKT